MRLLYILWYTSKHSIYFSPLHSIWHKRKLKNEEQPGNDNLRVISKSTQLYKPCLWQSGHVAYTSSPRTLHSVKWLTSLREFVSLIHTEINCRNHGQVLKWKHCLIAIGLRKGSATQVFPCPSHVWFYSSILKWQWPFSKMSTYSLKSLSSWSICLDFLNHRRQRECQLRIAISIHLPWCWVTQNSGTCKINTSFCSKPWWAFFLMHLDSSGKKNHNVKPFFTFDVVSLNKGLWDRCGVKAGEVHRTKEGKAPLKSQHSTSFYFVLFCRKLNLLVCK